jgi:hypothetical protein
MNVIGRVNIAELRGYVVLMNFWTPTCINSLRQALGTHGRMDDGA